jgi:hypothetical protein
MKEEKNRCGAPKGNQNARKHGFYSQVLNEAQQEQLKQAHEVQGIDEEIAIMRVKLLTIMNEHPDRIDLQTVAANAIARLVNTRHNIGKNEKKGLKAAISKVYDEIGLPLGIKLPEK